ncbi:hypothetical protein CC80DRAFT_504312 [Byssothecium circinans]|uniref:Uncharacterized protein n=1 Tax=Byssothecium circinans TaxID=147558 RepID=A0A6A5TVX9_9PLEO|nr:hypothetical protein CC80DRAFT_504312 [Byssothecium circinans]
MGCIPLQVEGLKTFPITKQLYFLAEGGFITYPCITTTMIHDKNKSDGLARLIATIQIFWFTLVEVEDWSSPIRDGKQAAMSSCPWREVRFPSTTLSTISHPIKGHATTTLEVTTLAYIFLQPNTTISLHSISSTGRGGQPANSGHTTSACSAKCRLCTSTKSRFLSGVFLVQFHGARQAFVILVLVVASAYSSIFLAPWDFHFPTEPEKLIWRICSARSMGIVLVGGVFEVTGMLIEYYRRGPFVLDLDLEHRLHGIPVPVRSHPLVEELKTQWQVFLQNARNKDTR